MSPPEPTLADRHAAPGPATALTPTEASSRRIAALDGLRGFALVGMLLWHAEVGWVQGGFARMTIFFTLSGYLGTRTWQRMQARPEGGGFRSFWWRRARRLLPLGFVGVAVAVATTAWTGTPAMRDRLPGDVLSVLGYASNIRFWQSEQSYGYLFTEPSLLQHYWTLSIEEQSVIVLPLLLAGVGLVAGTRSRRAALVVAVVAVACAGFPAVVDHTPDAVWYSSIVRFGEFSAGAALALWTSGHPSSPRPRLLGLAGGAALAGLAVVMVTIPRDAEWLYRGGMGLFIAPTLVCLAACARNLGPAARVLETVPLRLLGRWTFSIYVLHWPLFWVVDATRTGLAGWELATLRIALAVAVGAVVHVVLERPLMASDPRAGDSSALDRWLAARVPAGWWRTRPAAGALAGSAATLVLAATLATAEPDYDFEAARDRAAEIGGDLRDGAIGATRVGIFGGSIAVQFALGGVDWFDDHDELALAAASADLGCGLVTDGVRMQRRDAVTGEPELYPPPAACRRWPTEWRRSAAGVEVAVVVPGTWDAVEWQIDDEIRTIGDPSFDDIVRTQVDLAVEVLRGAGVQHVLFATAPILGGPEWEARGLDARHESTIARLNEMLAEAAEVHDDVSIVDLADWVSALSGEVAERLLPDGLHPTWDTAPEIWEELIGPAVLAVR